MAPRPLVYENVAIGMIAQRVGECRFANRYLMSPRQVITQQTRSLEKLYRDSIIAEGDKLIVIEFKSPYVIKSSYINREILRYANIDFGILTSIAKRFNDENVFLALIHAYLPNSAILRKATPGFYLWLATPGTTAFIPLSQLTSQLKVKSHKLTLDVIISRPSVDVNYVSVLIPSCAAQPTPIVKFEPYCASCGGLLLRPRTLRKPKISVVVNGSALEVESYTFASLMKMFTRCPIGFRVKHVDEIGEILRHILVEVTSPLALLVLSRGKVSFISLPYRQGGWSESVKS